MLMTTEASRFTPQEWSIVAGGAASTSIRRFMPGFVVALRCATTGRRAPGAWSSGRRRAARSAAKRRRAGLGTRPTLRLVLRAAGTRAEQHRRAPLLGGLVAGEGRTPHERARRRRGSSG